MSPLHPNRQGWQHKAMQRKTVLQFNYGTTCIRTTQQSVHYEFLTPTPRAKQQSVDCKSLTQSERAAQQGVYC